MKETSLTEIRELDGGGMCFSLMFNYWVGPGGVCVTVHVQFE